MVCRAPFVRGNQMAASAGDPVKEWGIYRRRRSSRQCCSLLRFCSSIFGYDLNGACQKRWVRSLNRHYITFQRRQAGRGCRAE